MSTPWQGTDYIEKQINHVRNGLVGITLHGVSGVSPDIGESRKMYSPSEADTWIDKAISLCGKLRGQKPPGKAKAWFERHVHDLERLMNTAIDVRMGRITQNMTKEKYAELRKSLGV